MNIKKILILVLSCASLGTIIFSRNELSMYMEQEEDANNSSNPFYADENSTTAYIKEIAQQNGNQQDVTDITQEELSSTLTPQEKINHADHSKTISTDTQTTYQDKKTTEEQGSFDEFAPKIPLELLEEKIERTPKTEAERSIEFNFEDADLKNLVVQIESIFDVTFISDDAIEPLAQGGKILKGNKISFKTQKPLTKQEAWNLFVTFLDLSGFAITPEGQNRIYRIKTIKDAMRSPVSSYIGINPNQLPDNDEIIRYIYFIKNVDAKTIDGIVQPLKSAAASYIMLNELRAFILIDKAYNIKSLMKIVKEIDKSAMPQSMSVLKLRQADAMDVQKLYQELVKTDDPGYGPRAITQRKQPTTTYFPENATIIAEPRSNALIILGPEDTIKKIEEFITKYVDIELDQPYSPLFVYPVKYADAQNIADVMNRLTSDFGSGTEAARFGGVRGGDKYTKPMSFTAERETNQLVIKGDYEDYLRVKNIIDSLDEPQPQVAIEVLLVSVDINKSKELGSQIRTKIPGPDGLLGKNVNFQTSGIKFGRSQGSSIIPKIGKEVTTGAQRLLGNLLNTVLNPSLAGVGNTVINFGVDACGVWGIFNILESMSSAEVISNPFLVATNKTKAEVSVGQTRRVVTSTVVSGDNNPVDGFGDFTANLTLTISPQINSDGMIVLDITIENDEFTGATDDPSTAAKINRIIDTKTILADKEVLAIGGIIQNRTLSSTSKLPILGDIPILGWLFKNKSKLYTKSNIVALISVRIVEPNKENKLNAFTQHHMNNYNEAINYMQNSSTAKDPVNALFFKDRRHTTDRAVEDLIFERAGKPLPTENSSQRYNNAKKKRSKWANKRGRRKYKNKVKEEKPPSDEQLRETTNEMIDQLIAKNDSVRKTAKKQSLFETMLYDDEDQA